MDDVARTGLQAACSSNVILLRDPCIVQDGPRAETLHLADSDHVLEVSNGNGAHDLIMSLAGPKSGAERRSAATSHEEVVALLKVGTAAEVTERAAKARAENSKKGQWARDAHEALNIIAAGGYTKADGTTWCSVEALTCDSVTGSLYYGASEWKPAKLATPLCRDGSLIEVHNGTTLAALELLESSKEASRRIGALNFASARNPGGGFTTGAAAQEESLARSSALYPCLTRYFREFFIPSRQAESGAYTHDIIYSPGVAFFRDDAGRLLENPYLADIVTAAAPNVKCVRRGRPTNKQVEKMKKAEDEESEKVLRERIPRVLDVFARHGVTDLVLGAWGCGVFGNNPAVVAQIFAEVLQGQLRGQFGRVIFAVLDTEMAQVFASTFQTDMIPPTSEGSQWGAARKWR